MRTEHETFFTENQRMVQGSGVRPATCSSWWYVGGNQKRSPGQLNLSWSMQSRSCSENENPIWM
ncbi:hypothetical protein, partial [Escherichia coli]|uniref:hypothetical protein n=1 Tax=Escherichia coli TaxID=562 RepID=UPI0034E53BA2